MDIGIGFFAAPGAVVALDDLLAHDGLDDIGGTVGILGAQLGEFLADEVPQGKNAGHHRDHDQVHDAGEART